MIFLFPRWDMLIPWRVTPYFSAVFVIGGTLHGGRLTGHELRSLRSRPPMATPPWVVKILIMPLSLGWRFFCDFFDRNFQWKEKTRWCFQTCFIFTPTWGNDPIWLYDIFQMGWNHQLVKGTENEDKKASWWTEVHVLGQTTENINLLVTHAVSLGGAQILWTGLGCFFVRTQVLLVLILNGETPNLWCKKAIVQPMEFLALPTALL